MAWVLVEGDRGLGGPLAWADRHDGAPLHVLAEGGAGELARQAAAFAPAPTVWLIDGRVLRPATPAPLPVPPALSPGVAAQRDVIEAAGAEPVEEHGVLSGEVAGLEVCRVVVGPDGKASLEVGIGPQDREAAGLLHGDDMAAALAGVVSLVAVHRRPSSPPHPLNRLARGRALRHRLVRDPSLVGLTRLEPAPPPVPRRNGDGPCAAIGVDPSGRPVVVVCSAGIDLDLAPFASDARLALGGGSRLVLAVPEGDDHPVTRRLASLLSAPAEVVPVPPAVGAT